MSYRLSLRSSMLVVCLGTCLVLGARQPWVQAQALTDSPAPVAVALGAGAPSSAVEELDARVATMVAAGQLILESDVVDPLDAGRRHEYFTQIHAGVRVLGGGVSRQRVDGLTVSAFGTLYLGIALSANPALSTAAATSTMQLLEATTPGPRGADPLDATVTLIPDSPMALLVLPELDGTYRLVYRGTFSDGIVRFLDASTGAFVRSEEAFSRQRTAGSGRGTHGDVKKVSTTQTPDGFQLLDQLRPAPIVTRTTQGSGIPFNLLFMGTAGRIASDADNEWTNAAAVDAHAHAGWTYDYFNQRMGWAGLDGQNLAINQVVTDRETIANAAFFAPPASSSGTGLVAFGMSSGGLTMATLDIVAHELMHGVTYFSLRRRTGAGLTSGFILDGVGPTEARLQGQSLSCSESFQRLSDGTIAPFVCQNGAYVLVSNHGGAINEGFSDVFGTAVEFRYQAAGQGVLRADYLIAEDAVLGGPAILVSGLTRSLSDPPVLPVEVTGAIRHPDHYDRRVRYTLVSNKGVTTLSQWAIVDGQFVAVPADNGGEHWNATLLGHVFYRAIEGGTHRTSGRSVAGVGAENRELIEKVFFRAMNLLMPSAATFHTAAAVLRQSAVDLYGSSSPSHRAINESLLAAGL